MIVGEVCAELSCPFEPGNSVRRWTRNGSHLAMKEADLRAGGMRDNEMRRAAQMRLGNDDAA